MRSTTHSGTRAGTRVVDCEWTPERIEDLFTVTAGGDLDRTSSSPVKTDHHIHPIYANSLSQNVIYGYSRYGTSPAGAITVTARGTLGRASYRNTSFVAIGRLLVLVPKVDMDARFFSEYINYGVRFSIESTGVPQLTAPQISRHTIPVPPKTEQGAIAEMLSDADCLLDSLDTLIAKKLAIQAAMMQQLFGGKTRLPGFLDPWKPRRLADVGRTYSGLAGKKAGDFRHGTGRYLTFLAVLENVAVGDRDTGQVHVAPTEVQNLTQRGDVLFNSTSETAEDLALGAAVAEESEGLFLNSFCFGLRIRDPRRFLPLFLAYHFRSPTGREMVRKLAQGATRHNLSKRQFLSLMVHFPQREEQRAISRVMRDMDAEIEALEQRRDKTHALKQGMMQQLLTGRTRLTQPQTAGGGATGS